MSSILLFQNGILVTALCTDASSVSIHPDETLVAEAGGVIFIYTVCRVRNFCDPSRRLISMIGIAMSMNSVVMSATMMSVKCKSSQPNK